MDKRVSKEEDGASMEIQFCFEFVDCGRSFKLQIPVSIPSDVGNVKKLTQRLINFHSLPVYIEEGKPMLR